jgi:ankyrin repeat protein
MHSAVQNGQLEMILLLLEYDADLNVKSAEGLTPLDMAMEKGHTQAIELLREHGAL